MTEERPTAAYYRKTADDLRKLAGNAQLPEVRRELLDLAERFERLAEYLKRRIRPGAAKRRLKNTSLTSKPRRGSDPA